MTKTAYGYLHIHEGEDMDGTRKTFESVGPEPQKFGMTDSQLEEYGEKAGWFAKCVVEPEMGFVGPFDTEAEAIEVASNEDKLHQWEKSLVEVW